MAELFLELLSEEIPARMQEAAEKMLADAVADGLAGSGLAGGRLSLRSWSGPRRLAVCATEVAPVQPDRSAERRGPRADAPKQAIDGFLKSAGVSRNEAEVRQTPKGDFLFAVIDRKGEPAGSVLPGLVTGVLSGFTWPKEMRWNRSRHGWIRPLHRITALLDGKALDGNLDLGGGVEIAFGNASTGHSMMAPEPFPMTGADQYEQELEKRFVIASRARRMDIIQDQLRGLAGKNGLALRDDPGLLAEVAGLVEFPNALLGRIDGSFMELPEEILVTSMRSHQKYFAFKDGKGKLAPVFATVANMAPDKERDATIIAGNERVLRARLADAEFFWGLDRAEGLESMASRLGSIMFFEKLGTMADKSGRIAGLAAAMAEASPADLDADPAAARRAGLLAKADLASQTVGEFPETQGVIGGYLADGDMAEAIAGHYSPQGPDDAIPETGLGRVVALADKIDTLVGFFGIGLAPTGSKDPHALRRAALGVIRIVIESGMVLPLAPVLDEARKGYNLKAVPGELMGFLHDRLKVWLRERGVRHDIVAAVVRPGHARADDLTHLFRMAEALTRMLGTDDGKGLLAGYTRTAKILAAEEKKDGSHHGKPVDSALLKAAEEKALFKAVEAMGKPVESTDEAIGRMESLGKLRARIDDFFEAVVVNDGDPKVRDNRLNLLGRIRDQMDGIADFSAIEG